MKWETIGFPILILSISIISCIWLAFIFKKRTLNVKFIISWTFLNSIFLLVGIYLLIIGIIFVSKSFKWEEYKELNFFIYISNVFFGEFSQGWIIMFSFIYILFTMFFSLTALINISIINYKTNELNKNLAILKGKISIDLNELDFNTSELSSEELKILFEEQVTKEKLKQKYINKLKRINNLENFDDTNIKTLLNINLNKNKKKNNNKNEILKKLNEIEKEWENE